MVVIAAPPPDPRRRLSPQHVLLPADSELFRLFDPADSYRPGPTTFRDGGSTGRFDHLEPADIGRRAIYYCSRTLEGAVAETFGDRGIIQAGTKHLARVRPIRGLNLLDLRGRAAQPAGTVAGISMSDHPIAQQWSCYIWSTLSVYRAVDGILYTSAHNGDDCVALYERAEGSLACPRGWEAPLTDPDVYATIAACANTLVVEPLP